MRMSDLRRLVADEFGESYGPMLLATQSLTALGMTGDEALAARVPPRRVWAALCDQMDVPAERRLGREVQREPGPGMEP